MRTIAVGCSRAYECRTSLFLGRALGGRSRRVKLAEHA